MIRSSIISTVWPRAPTRSSTARRQAPGDGSPASSSRTSPGATAMPAGSSWRPASCSPCRPLAGFLVVLADPQLAEQVLPADLTRVVRDGQLWTDIPAERRALAASTIATNNIRVSILAFAGGILLGTLTVYVLVLNGLLFGAIFGYTHLYGLDGSLLAFVSPHGYLELTVIFIAGGAGLRMAWGIVHPGLLWRRDALVRARPGGGAAVSGRATDPGRGGADRGVRLAVEGAGRGEVRGWAADRHRAAPVLVGPALAARLGRAAAASPGPDSVNDAGTERGRHTRAQVTTRSSQTRRYAARPATATRAPSRRHRPAQWYVRPPGRPRRAAVRSRPTPSGASGSFGSQR